MLNAISALSALSSFGIILLYQTTGLYENFHHHQYAKVLHEIDFKPVKTLYTWICFTYSLSNCTLRTINSQLVRVWRAIVAESRRELYSLYSRRRNNAGAQVVRRDGKKKLCTLASDLAYHIVCVVMQRRRLRNQSTHPSAQNISRAHIFNQVWISSPFESLTHALNGKETRVLRRTLSLPARKDGMVFFCSETSVAVLCIIMNLNFYTHKLMWNMTLVCGGNGINM